MRCMRGIGCKRRDKQDRVLFCFLKMRETVAYLQGEEGNWQSRSKKLDNLLSVWD